MGVQGCFLLLLGNGANCVPSFCHQVAGVVEIPKGVMETMEYDFYDSASNGS